jgi:hypothetical protein
MKPLTPVIFKNVTAGGTAVENATDFEDTTNFVGTMTSGTITPAQITVGSHITNAELNSGLRITDWAEAKASEMANAVMDKVTALILTGTFTATPLTSAAAAFGGSELNELWGRTGTFTSRSLVLNSPYLAQLLPLTRENFNVLEGMSWPGWQGIYEQTRWTGATANTVGFVSDPSRAIGMVAGLPLLPSTAQNQLYEETFLVPGIELTVAKYSWFNPATRTDWVTFDIVFGAAVIDATAGIIIKSA